MTTNVAPPVAEGHAHSAADHDALSRREIRIYGHSLILYWWPVWTVGFLFALLTGLDGGRMAYVPAGTVVENTNTLVAPVGTAPLEQPREHVARSPYLGTWFFITMLVVFIANNVQLRGLWEWVAMLTVALLVAVMSLYDLWGRVFGWFNLLHIYINLAGYLFLSLCMFSIWVLSVFVFDRRTYMIITAGQVRVVDHVGEAEKTYDVTNLTFQVQPNVFLRHRILGVYGAGDIVVRTGGPRPEELEWPNVLFARSRVKQIQELLKSREVV